MSDPAMATTALAAVIAMNETLEDIFPVTEDHEHLDDVKKTLRRFYEGSVQAEEVAHHIADLEVIVGKQKSLLVALLKNPTAMEAFVEMFQ